MADRTTSRAAGRQAGGGREPARLVRRVSAHEAGRRLVDLLADWVPAVLGRAVARDRVRAMVRAGAVRVEGVVRRVPGRPVRRGELLTASLRDAGAAAAPAPPFDASVLLYEDDAIVVVDKPAGLPTHATADPGRPHLVGRVIELLASRRGRASVHSAALAVHQRLDRDTSGVVLFAVDPAANAPLARAFAQGEVEKTYLALTARPAVLPPPRFRIAVPLEPRAKGGPRGPVRAFGPGARPAVTDVLVRETLAGALFVEARPRTGRKHQIRVHLSQAGMPVLGDSLYAAGHRPPLQVPHLLLHAWRLALRHPITGRRVVFEAPLPADFRHALAAASRGAGRQRA